MSVVSRAETAAHREARRTGRLEHPHRRRTLSGRSVPADYECLPGWEAIVGKPESDPLPKPRTGTYYWQQEIQAEREAFQVDRPFTGRNRTQRRPILKKMGLLGSFSKQLSHNFGIAWADNLEARRRIAQINKDARSAARYKAWDPATLVA